MRQQVLIGPNVSDDAVLDAWLDTPTDEMEPGRTEADVLWLTALRDNDQE